MVICCDILSECALNADLIDAQVEQLMTLAEKYDVEYDGWGTCYEDPNPVKKTATMTKILSMKTTMVFATVADGYGGACRRIARNFHGLPADTLPIINFLHCPTPQAWIDEARKLENLPLLPTDHMVCELESGAERHAAGASLRRG